MLLNRREFLAVAAGGVAFGLLPSMSHALAGEAASKANIKAIAFDALAVLDPRPVFLLAQQLFPGQGVELGNEWRTRQFEYTWLRVTTQHYTDFWQVTRDALEFAAAKLHLELTDEKREKLLDAYLELKAWPDAIAALASLKKSGFRLAFLSNFTSRMLEADIQSAGLNDLFEHALSTDTAKTFKPDPRAYQLAMDVLKLQRQEILFVAFAGWDAAGAKLFGYPTYWLNRQKLPLEKLDATPDGTGETMSDLVRFLA